MALHKFISKRVTSLCYYALIQNLKYVTNFHPLVSYKDCRYVVINFILCVVLIY